MKKITAVFLMLCMLTGFIPAAAQSEACVSLSHDVACPGDTVKVELNLDGCDGFVNLGLEISYDSDVFTLMDVSPQNDVGATCTMAQSINKNPFNIGWDSTENTNFNGTLAILTFKVSPYAPSGDYPISVDFYKGRNGDYTDGSSVNYDENENPLNLTYQSGHISVRRTPSSSGGGGSGEPDADSVIVALSKTSAHPGDMVDVVLDLSNNSGFANLGLEISYDRNALTLVSVTEFPGVGATFTPAQTLEAYPYNFGWDSVSDVHYNGQLATFTFKVAENAEKGDYPIGISFYKGRNGNYVDGSSVNYDEKENPLDMYYSEGNVSVSYAPLLKPEETTENTYNGNVYMYFDASIPWEDAKKLCEEAGGHLATVTSLKENEFVSSLCKSGKMTRYMLGANKLNTSGIWTWVTSESFIYTNWDKAASSTAASYITLDTEGGKWFASTDSTTSLTGFVCEWEGNNSGNESTYWVEFESQKTTYAKGEDFEVDVWLYTDNSVIRIYDYEVNGFDSSKPGTYSVTVSYGEFSQVFEAEVTDDKEVEAVVTRVVRSEAKNGATISPSGYTEVKDGTVMKFVIGTQEGYSFDRVIVNGEPMRLSDGNLSITVNQDTVIEAYGEKKSFSIDKEVHGNGTIVLSKDTAEYGSSLVARITADEGYVISDVTVDGKSVGVCSAYTFADIKDNHIIEATFEEVVQTLTVKASANSGGKIYPARSIVNKGSSVKFTLTPDYGYHASYALVNNEAVTVASNEIILSNVTEDTTVAAVFEKNIYPVSVQGCDGAEISVSYNGNSGNSIDVPYQDIARIEIVPEDGYKLNTLYVNNAPVKATRWGDRLIYNATITKSTVVIAKCGLTRDSQFSLEVAKAGLAAYINKSNAYAEKEKFVLLADKYAKLTDEEKKGCASAYATVLSAINRANAYIALIESGIESKIGSFPAPDALSSGNYLQWKDEIDNAYTEYENMTQLSRSLIDYKLVKKLSDLRDTTERIEKESIDALEYLYSLIDSVSEDDNLSTAYSRLLLAEDTYHNMDEAIKENVSEDKFNEMIAKRGRISTKIQKMYATPFTAKVLRASGVTVSDTVEEAEAKRVIIYDLMNEYHSFPAFVQEQISQSAIQRMNALYESASITVSTTVNNLPVDMNGDFDEDVELVLSEPELDDSIVADATGKALYQAIDVKMYSDNQEIQPSSKIRIKMEISKELSDADVSVVYIDDDGMVFDVQGEVIEENGKYYIVFFIDHFSNFAVLYSEDEVTETRVSFDTEYAGIGDYLTASVTGTANTSDCQLIMVGYSESGAITFIEKGTGSVTATVAENTNMVKAMLWRKNITPVAEAQILYVGQ